jgi:hypothetical protein
MPGLVPGIHEFHQCWKRTPMAGPFVWLNVIDYRE